MNLFRTLTFALVLAAAAVLSGCAGDSGSTTTAASVVKITDGWVRATAGTTDTSMTAAFMNIDNGGSTDVELVAARSDISPMVQIHEMAMVDGKQVMQQMDGGLVISAGRGKSLAPGGNHIMLMGLTGELKPGDEISLTLEFSDGSTVDLTLPVKAFTEEEPHYHATDTPSADASATPSATM